MKKTIKVYLDNETINSLKHKAEEINIEGRAWLSHYLEALSKQDIILFNDNVRKVIRALDLK